ncbi:VOC family protein [Methylocella sp.]|uniref:VOC family protein n=1 Tax=Methylocella sp. TaxID=1978226 RepID=UPI003784500B
MNETGSPGAVLTPYVTVADAAAAIDFYLRAFGAREIMRVEHLGKVGHAELSIAGARIMLSDEFPEHQALSPRAYGGTPVMLHLYVDDVDAFAARAGREGLRTREPVRTQFYGDRGGKFEDPFGLVWWIATHVEDVSLDEIRRRAAALHEP